MLFHRTITILIAALLVSAAAARDVPTTPSRTLVVSTQSLLGTPLQQVAFTVSAQPDFEQTATTGRTGMATLRVPADAKLGEARFDTANGEYEIASVMGAAGSHANRMIYFLQLYPANPEEMTAAERQAYVDMLPAILAYQRKSGAAIPGEASNPHRLRLSALLNVFRGQEKPWGAAARTEAKEELMLDSGDGKSEDPAPTIIATVVDALGQPVGQRVVELYGLINESAEAEIVRRGRTDTAGEVVFRGLDAGHFYRILLPGDGDNLSARGPIMLVDEVKEYRTRPLVLRPNDQTVSGLVFYGDAPLPRARVRVSRRGEPTLEATTDRFGYFEIGPLDSGPVEIIVLRSNTDETVSVRETVGDEEVFIPVETLLLPVKKASEPEVRATVEQ